MKRLTCGITMGDAAGIGPEVVLKALQKKKVRNLADFVIIGNSFVMEETAQLLKIKADFNTQKGISLLNVGNTSDLILGKPVLEYGALALDCIKTALDLIRKKKINLLVTAPVNKHTINQSLRRSGHSFRGHTEYLARQAKVKNFAMMLTGGPMRVVLVSRHIALKQVPGAITMERIIQTVKLTASALRRYFNLKQPRIAVCGLNPHSGDNGTLGKEELEVIQPALRGLRTVARVEGPFPADSLFYSVLQGKYDAVVAMYHDQGLIPLKMLFLHQAVNITLGLPFVRTSCGHGTAYDIAGKNIADPGSMIEAIKLAVKVGKH